MKIELNAEATAAIVFASICLMGAVFAVAAAINPAAFNSQEIISEK